MNEKIPAGSKVDQLSNLKRAIADEKEKKGRRRIQCTVSSDLDVLKLMLNGVGDVCGNLQGFFFLRTGREIQIHAFPWL